MAITPRRPSVKPTVSGTLFAESNGMSVCNAVPVVVGVMGLSAGASASLRTLHDE
jgi:hypothetical protein